VFKEASLIRTRHTTQVALALEKSLQELSAATAKGHGKGYGKGHAKVVTESHLKARGATTGEAGKGKANAEGKAVPGALSESALAWWAGPWGALAVVAGGEW